MEKVKRMILCFEQIFRKQKELQCFNTTYVLKKLRNFRVFIQNIERVRLRNIRCSNAIDELFIQFKK